MGLVLRRQVTRNGGFDEETTERQLLITPDIINETIQWRAMMSVQKEKWRIVRAAIAAKSDDNEAKKVVGETAAAIWLEHEKTKKNLDYFALNTKIYDKPRSLSALGGKRPDFCAEIAGELVYLDAKYHRCDNDEFFLEDDEIEMYRKLRDWLPTQGDTGDRDIVFMVFPQKHHATQLVFVHLDELIRGQAFITDHGQPAKKVSILDRDELTFKVSLVST
jgi:hypothetical protein